MDNFQIFLDIIILVVVVRRAKEALLTIITNMYFIG